MAGSRNLLPLAGPISQRVSLSDYADQVVGVDGCGWLLQSRKRHPSSPHTEVLSDASSRLSIFTRFSIRPYFMFNGATLPLKREAFERARALREQELQLAVGLNRERYLNRAFIHYMNSAEVTYSLVVDFIKILTSRSIPFLVSPSESLAQLAYLGATGLVAAILTNDPEIFFFNPICPILFRCFEESCHAVQVRFAEFLSHLQFDLHEFLACCALAGSSFTRKVSKLGLIGTMNFFRKRRDIKTVILELSDGEFLKEFELAMAVFRYIKVYNPEAETVTTLSPSDSTFECLGPNFESDDELGLFVSGEIDPRILKCDLLLTESPIPFFPRDPAASRTRT
jgi:exonuclease-1